MSDYDTMRSFANAGPKRTPSGKAQYRVTVGEFSGRGRIGVEPVCACSPDEAKAAAVRCAEARGWRSVSVFAYSVES